MRGSAPAHAPPPFSRSLRRRYSRAEGDRPESQCASQWFQVQDADAPEFAAHEFCVTKMANINENFTRVAEAEARAAVAMNASRN